MAKLYGQSGIVKVNRPIIAQRAPTSNDTMSPEGGAMPISQRWIDEPGQQEYVYMGQGVWDAGGVGAATTTDYGTVLLDTDGTFASADDDHVPTTLATKTYVDAVASFGAPIAGEKGAGSQGIGYVATDAEAVARQANTAGVESFFLTPANLDAVLASPSAIGGTAAAAGTFTSLTADGTGTVSLTSNAAALFDVTGAGNDLTLSSDAGRVVINGEEAAADAVRVLSAAGGLDVDVALQMSLVSSQNAADAIVVNASAGGIDITAAGAAGEDIDLVNTAGSVNVTAGEAIATAIVINATAGGLDLLAGGGAGLDTDITNTSGSVNITAGEAVANAVRVNASAGGIDVDAAGQVNIASSNNAADAVVIIASAGGVDITATGTAGEDLDLLASGSSVNVTATEDAAQAIYIRANGGVSETIDVHADQGTGVASINVHSDVGGVTITSGLASADAININASDAAGGIDIDAGTAGVIVDTTGGISLDSQAASNFTATGAFDITFQSTAGSLLFNAGEAAADALNMDAAAGGLDVDVALQMNLDSSQAAADAVRVNASNAAGGIDVDAGTGGIALDSTGAISLDGGAASNFSVSGAGIDLTLASSAGRVVVNGEEAAADALRIFSAAGGMDVDAALQINIATSQNAADAMVLNASAGGIDITAAGAAGEDLDLACTAGSTNISAGEADAAAITINASAGGMDISTGGAGLDMDLTATGGSINLTATEAAADAIVISASDAAGGISIDAGSGGINTTGADVTITGGDLILATAATRIEMQGGAVTDFIGSATLVNGVVTVANTNIAANDLIFLSRQSINGSTAIGLLTYSISAATSFTVTSVQESTPGSTQTNDQSIVKYVIFRMN